MARATGGAEPCPVPPVGCWVCGWGVVHCPPYCPCTARLVRIILVQSYNKGAKCESFLWLTPLFISVSLSLLFGRKQCLRAVSTPLHEPKVHLAKLPSALYFVGFLSLVPFCKLLLITLHVAPGEEFLEVQFGSKSICIHKQLDDY